MTCVYAASVPNKKNTVQCKLGLFGGFPHTAVCTTCLKFSSDETELVKIQFDGNLATLKKAISEFIASHPLGHPFEVILTEKNVDVETLVKDYALNGENVILTLKEDKRKSFPSKDVAVVNGKNRLVAGLITLNMGHFIGNTISSIIGCADKIVVLDGGSKDNTVEVLRSFGDKVVLIQCPWMNDFGAARNMVLECVKSLEPEWYFQIDADEVMAPQFASKVGDYLARDTAAILTLPILWLISSDPPRYIASNYHTALAPYRMRLWRCHDEMHFRWGRKVHEFLETKWPNSRIVQVEDMDMAIHHYSYILFNYQARLNKVKFYDSIRAEAGSGESAFPAYLYEHYPYEIRDLTVDFREPIGERHEQGGCLHRHE